MALAQYRRYNLANPLALINACVILNESNKRRDYQYDNAMLRWSLGVLLLEHGGVLWEHFLGLPLSGDGRLHSNVCRSSGGEAIL